MSRFLTSTVSALLGLAALCAVPCHASPAASIVANPAPASAEEGKPEAALPETCFLFSYFTKNGEDGLRLAWSPDGYNWKAIPGSGLIKPMIEDKIMRDPCIQQGPDGTFHMVWTSSWSTGGFGYASSRDLIHWSEQKYVPAMKHEAQVQNTWAPELSYDTTTGEWLIIWSSTIAGRFADTDPKRPEGSGKQILNHRLYATRTKDFSHFTPTILFYDDGYSVIDATLVHVGERYAMVVKDERTEPEPHKDLRLAWSRSLTGPYGASAPSFTHVMLPVWLEGPTVLKVGEKWFLYADAYRNKHYVLLTSTDFANWKDESASLSYPPGLRHGTAFAVQKEVLQALLKVVSPK